MWIVLKRLTSDDAGQDIIEYALLTASLGVLGVAIWPVIAATIGTVYQTLDADTQQIWEPPDPGASS